MIETLMGTTSATQHPTAIGVILQRCAVGFSLSFAITALVARMLLALAGSRWRRGMRQEHCPKEIVQRHAKRGEIPALGGIAMLIGQLATFGLLMNRECLAGWILAATSLLFGILGIWDDVAKLRSPHRSVGNFRRDLSARSKFRLQVLCTSVLLVPLLAFGGASQRLLKAAKTEVGSNNFDPAKRASIEAPASMRAQCAELTHYSGEIFAPWKRLPLARFQGWWRLPLAGFFIFVVVGSSNAVNLTDGLDGLAGGCGVIASLTLMIGALSCAMAQGASLELNRQVQSAQISIYLASIAGASGGFLLLNLHPARIFMGDGGSLSLGASLGMAALLLRLEWLLVFGAGIFAIETLSVILQVMSFRFRNGKRVLLCSPLHHHFECLGWAETRIARAFWIAAGLLASVGLLLLWHAQSSVM